MKIPAYVLRKFEKAAAGMGWGTVTLSLVMNRGKPRYVIRREESFIPDESSLNENEGGQNANT